MANSSKKLADVAFGVTGELYADSGPISGVVGQLVCFGLQCVLVIHDLCL